MDRYRSARSRLETGDIVLFSSRKPLGNVIQLVTRSKWTHVGMIIRSDVAILLWESRGLSSLLGLAPGGDKRGVALVSLSDRLRDFVGEVWVRPLEVERTPEMLKKLAELREDVSGRDYEAHITELMKAYYDGPLGNNTEELSTIFCSELVAEAYQCMGLLAEPPQGMPSNEYTPIDFARGLPLLKGSLGAPFQIWG